MIPTFILGGLLVGAIAGWRPVWLGGIAIASSAVSATAFGLIDSSGWNSIDYRKASPQARTRNLSG